MIVEAWYTGHHSRLRADSVGLEFMTDDASEAEEVRQHWLTFDWVAKVLVLDEPARGQFVRRELRCKENVIALEFYPSNRAGLMR